ncbi:hypothetical protein IAU60_006200 [Kwoniella sp. DSM 27419]
MRLPLFGLVLALVPAILAVTPTLTSHSVEQRSETTDNRKPRPQCQNIPTRNHRTCHCLPGFVEPDDYWRRDLGVIDERNQPYYEDCVCPDKPNTYVDWGYGGWKRKGGELHPQCRCKGDHQFYDIDDERCECKPGYEPVDNHYFDNDKKGGHHRKPLKCKRRPQPSGGYSHGGGKGESKTKRAPSLREVIKMREADAADASLASRALEDFLECDNDQKACKTHGQWACTDISSSLSSCGGCPGEGIDCGAIPGVSEVRCVMGSCVIDSCRRGYAISTAPDASWGINTTCTRQVRFVSQG